MWPSDAGSLAIRAIIGKSGSGPGPLAAVQVSLGEGVSLDNGFRRSSFEGNLFCF